MAKKNTFGDKKDAKKTAKEAKKFKAVVPVLATEEPKKAEEPTPEEPTKAEEPEAPAEAEKMDEPELPKELTKVEEPELPKELEKAEEPTKAPEEAKRVEEPKEPAVVNGSPLIPVPEAPVFVEATKSEEPETAFTMPVKKEPVKVIPVAKPAGNKWVKVFCLVTVRRYIGGVNYNLTKGKETQVPPEVAAIFRKAGKVR